MNHRFFCLHGHFYQPPRENPWTGEVETEANAAPAHDWNERITAECYAPNAAAHIYERISFNFGPTLLAWMEKKSPEVYRAILEADRASQLRFDGHGSAIAQAYNHMILPLANSRDKFTQVYWGIRDFEHRFGRRPEGMWLAETAVDRESLEVMAGLGLRFTILSPHQAAREVNSRVPYLADLPSDRKLSLFFYDPPLSQGLAFGGLLHNGDELVQRIASSFSHNPTRPELVAPATDGETFGHHHKFGEMAVDYALKALEAKGIASLSNYGLFLDRYPSTLRVKVRDNTSWSCSHGIERWRRDCGCQAGAEPGWNQAWRTPLRESLDWLRDALIPLYETEASRYLKDPWEARNESIGVVLDPSSDSKRQFLDRCARRSLNPDEQDAAWRLLDLQRFAMLMFTSCGWFFSDPTDLGTQQILKYATRAIELAESFSTEPIRADFQTRLSAMKGNRPSGA